MARKRILVVEDYQQLRDLVRDLLWEVGRYAVEIAADGVSAERLIAQQGFDLAVLDIGVPGLVGAHEIAAALRGRSDCPILFITGRDLADTDVVELMQPHDRFLRKPFKMDVLLAEVGAMLKAGARKRVKATKRTQVRAAKAVQAGTTR